MAIGVWRRQGGVVPRLRGPLLGPSVLGTLACAAIGAGVLVAGPAAHFLLAGTVAGAVMAASFVAFGRLINRRIAILAGQG